MSCDNEYFTNPITFITNAFYTVPEAHAALELVESGFCLLPSPTDLRNAIQNGFENDTDSTITFTDGTRTLEIAPAVTSYNFWVGGYPKTKTAAESVVISDTEGMHYIYFDTDGTLSSTTTWDINTLIFQSALVAMVYWDADNNESIIVSNERHLRMDASVHSYLHEIIRCAWVSGLALGNMTVGGSGNLDIHAQLSVSDGVIRDEDLRHSITNGSPQTLSTIAEIPILYRSGADGYWRKLAATQFPITTTGTGRAAWNELTGGVWQLSEVTNNAYLCMHIVATSDIYHPVVALVGQAEYTTKNAAEQGAETELRNLLIGDLVTFAPEWKEIATIIVQTGSAKTNTVKSSIEPTADGGDYIDWRTASPGAISGAATTASHNDLLNRDAATAHPLEAVNTTMYEDTANNRIGFNVAAPVVELDLDGTLMLADNRTDATDKFFFILFPHRESVSESEGNILLYGYSSATQNMIFVGGGDASHNAATHIRFYTAANYNTRTGTERMRIDDLGYVGVNDDNPPELFTVKDGNIRLEHTGDNAHFYLYRDGVMAINMTSDSGQSAYLKAPNGRLYLDASSDIRFRPDASTELMRLADTGQLTVGGGYDGEEQLDVLGNILIATDRTDATTKYGTLASKHYTNAEEAITMAYAVNSSGNNLLYLGGGDANRNAVTQIIFCGTATTTGLGGSNWGRFYNGMLSIGSHVPEYTLDVQGAVKLGNFRTDSTNKLGVIVGAHYSTSEEPMFMIYGSSTATNNAIYLGGGYATFNAATAIYFFTAANNTTTTGTLAVTINSTGSMAIGEHAPAATLDVDGQFIFGSNRKVDNTNKYAYLQVEQYDKDEQLIPLLFHSGLVSANNLDVGGGSGNHNAVTRIAFFTASAVSTLEGTERMRIMNSGYIGINNAAPEEILDVSGNIMVGDIRTDNTVKKSHIVSPHYEYAEEPIRMLGAQQGSTYNIVYIGGGNGGYNAATHLYFYTGSDHKSTTGNLVGSVNTSGKWCIGGDYNAEQVLDVYGNLILANTRDDATNKTSLIMSPHYTNAEKDFLLFYGLASSTNNIVYVGGGSSVRNAATNLYFYTAGNNTTLSGYLRMRINSSGYVSIGGHNGEYPLDLKGNFLVGDNRTDETYKYFNFMCEHYDTNDVPFCIMQTEAGSSTNKIKIGGGAASLNSATQIEFYTGTDFSTTNGSLRLQINTAGIFNFYNGALQNLRMRDAHWISYELGSISGATTVNVENGNYQTCTITAATTFTFTNPVASGDMTVLALKITNGGAYTITWPGSVDWDGGTAPELQSSGVDEVIFTTEDGGSNWLGSRRYGDA